MFFIINLNKNYQTIQTYFAKKLKMRRHGKFFELCICLLLAIFILLSLKDEREPAMVKTYLSLLVFLELLIIRIFQSKSN